MTTLITSSKEKFKNYMLAVAPKDQFGAQSHLWPSYGHQLVTCTLEQWQYLSNMLSLISYYVGAEQ